MGLACAMKILVMRLGTHWKRLLTLQNYFIYPRKVRGRLFSASCSLKRNFTVRELITLKPLQQNVTVHGWVRAVRKQGSITFINIDDGSCWETLQIVDETNQKKPSYGSSVKIEGLLVTSIHKKQEVEIKCEVLTILGKCDGEDYPFPANQNHSVKRTREKLHLRPKLKSFGALLRIRSYATIAIHKFLQENGFFHINTPIITSNNCEGAGDIFSVQPQDTNSKNFFNIPAYLTVSGQLPLEAAVCGLSKVYTFGPAFRAENSRTRRHLSEFQMVEVEQAFITELNELLRLAEDLFKTSTRYVLEVCSKDVEVHQNIVHPNYNKKIEKMLHSPFVQLTYSEAVTIIQKQESVQSSIKWGEALLSEHEDYLLKYTNDIPIFITNYPINITPFYMKTSADDTVECFDLIAPFGGEICGGSLREHDKNQLTDRINKAGVNLGPLLWYLELREFGSVPHGGFGLGFDRFLQTILGIPNIREVVPFPRWAHHCQM